MRSEREQFPTPGLSLKCDFRWFVIDCAKAVLICFLKLGVARGAKEKRKEGKHVAALHEPLMPLLGAC